MNHINQSTQHIRQQLFNVVGETRAKTHFHSYYGIFKDDLMFGLYKDGHFYLRVSDSDLNAVIKEQNFQPLSDPNLALSEKYFLIPPHILSDLKPLSTWFSNSLTEIQQNKNNSYYIKKNQIRNLPNMNFRIEKHLNKIKVYTVEDLIEKGEINAFVELVKLGIDVTENTLFRLHGALTNQFIYSLTDSKKQQLLTEADNALYAAGLRKRFTTR